MAGMIFGVAARHGWMDLAETLLSTLICWNETKINQKLILITLSKSN